MFGSCADKMENLDSGETTVRFSVAVTLGPPVNYDEVFIVNDKGFPVVPEPATLPLTATGLLGLATLVRSVGAIGNPLRTVSTVAPRSVDNDRLW